MSLEDELVALTQRYLASEMSLDDLYMWVQNRQEAFAELQDESVATGLSGSIMLTSTELFDGVLDEKSARTAVAEDFKQLLGATANP
jgi:hypothetical protein